jgi:hypothetical protein
MKAMWLVTIDGAPQRIDVALRTWGRRTIRVNGVAVVIDRGGVVLQPADFNVGSARCSVHTLAGAALFVNGARVEPHDDVSLSISRTTSLALAATSMGVATAHGASTDTAGWTLANRIVSFWTLAGGSIRRTTDCIEFAAVKPMYDIRLRLADIVDRKQHRSVAFRIHSIVMRDGTRHRFALATSTPQDAAPF